MTVHIVNAGRALCGRGHPSTWTDSEKLVFFSDVPTALENRDHMRLLCRQCLEKYNMLMIRGGS